MKRGDFIRKLSFLGLGSGLVTNPLFSSVFPSAKKGKLLILHTNDQHSRIDSFPADDKRYPNQGGVARRASLIKQLKSEYEHVLLLDCGDILQGTPYFNYFGGELEFRLMSEMGYDASTIGNHEFDGGMELLAKNLKTANFPMLNCNYGFEGTLLDGLIQPYKIFNFSGFRVGVTGVGIALKGLVPADLFGNVVYKNPILSLEMVANELKTKHSCDLVICLSHLGYKYEGNKVSDIVLAQNTSNVDIILGGHTHTFMKQLDIRTNLSGKEVAISQAGWAGLMLGKIEVDFQKGRGFCVKCDNISI